MSLVDRIIDKIKVQFEGEATGHDWHHIMRVYNMAGHIQQSEGGDKEVVELAALLHDISDYKFNGGKHDEGGKVAYQLLIENGASKELAEKVKYIVDHVGYKGAHTKTEMNTLEGQIVQDADRLDAIGAIGIARTFAYGGHKGQPIYDPNKAPTLHNTLEEYANAKTSTINHFYEKLLLLAERMNTKTAKKIADERQKVMDDFLEQFYHEWNFNK